MGFWNGFKRALGVGPPRSIDNKRLRKVNRSGSFSSHGSGGSALSGETATQGSVANAGFAMEPTGGPESIRVMEADEVEEMEEPETRGRPKRRSYRRLSKKKKVKGYQPSTTDIMRGAAPSPSTVEEGARDRVREEMGLPPISEGSFRSGDGSRPPSIIHSAPATIVESPHFQFNDRPQGTPPSARSGALSNVTRTPPSAPSPPLSRQTPRLQHTDGSLPSTRAPSVRAPSTKAPSTIRPRSTTTSYRKPISVRDFENGHRDDAHSIAATSYVSRTPKVARIHDIAEVIPVSRSLSAVREESIAGTDDDGVSRSRHSPARYLSPPDQMRPMSKFSEVLPSSGYAVVDQWAGRHKSRLDSIDDRLQALKAEVLQHRPPMRYFST
jgi:hypothetical protein